jgi:hypothetical protein
VLTKLCVLLALACSVFAGGSGAAEFGANDDTGKYLGDASGDYFTGMAAVGLKTNVMTLKWDPARPEEIPDQVLLDAALLRAREAGVQVVLALYGLRPTTFTEDGGTPEAFAAWAALVVRTYPQVTRVVVGNEPNQPRFWRPQFDAAGAQVSAAAFGRVLAVTYDALKAERHDLTVIGVGLSPRGNDRPNAPSNISTSPVRFLKALGDWYRRSGRIRPLMDHLSFHPYPQTSRDGLQTGYAWPNAGVADLGRIKLAIWDAFSGTAQPTTASGLKLHLNEVGWQVDTSWATTYTGVENVAVTDESGQAAIYGALVRLLGCDPSVAAVNLFGFVDDVDRAGFQAGLVRRDGSVRPAADAVRETLEATAGGCLGELTGWRATKRVVGAAADFGNLSRTRPGATRAWRFMASAREAATYRAGIFYAGTRSSLIERQLSARRTALVATNGTLRPYRQVEVALRLRVLPPGRYVYAIRFAAWANSARTSVVVSRPFRVAASS